MKAEKRVATQEDLRQAGIKGSATPSAKRVPSHSSLEEGSLSLRGRQPTLIACRVVDARARPRDPSRIARSTLS